jgi:hypothetical protein
MAHTLAAEYEGMKVKDAIKLALETESYEDKDGTGLAALEIANFLGIPRDIVTAQMTDLVRSGEVDYIESTRHGSKDARLYWLTGEKAKAVKVKPHHSLSDRARALVRFILIMASKQKCDDPVQDIDDIKEKAIELFPEF